MIQLSKIFIFLLITSSLSAKILSYEEEVNLEISVNKIMSKVGAEAENEFGLTLAGIGIGMPNNVVEKLTLSFNARIKLTKQEAKNILSTIANRLIFEANNNPLVFSQMKDSPFTVNNVSINIFFYDANGRRVFFPDFAVVDLSDGIYTFRTKDPNDPYKYKTRESEKYCETQMLK